MMMFKTHRIFTVLLAILVISSLIPVSAFAQSGRGTARQKVLIVDKDDNPIDGASVTIEFMDSRDPIIKMDGKSDKKGEVVFFGLGYGKYEISAKYKDLDPATKTITVSQVNINTVKTLKLTKSAKKIAEEKLQQEANLVGQGNQLFSDGKYQEALSAYQEFLVKNPEFYQLHLNIGNCHKELGQNDLAIAEFNKVIDAAKDEEKDKALKAKGYAAIGEIYLKDQDIDKATEFFQKSIALSPKDEILAYNVAEIYFASNNNEEALKYYDIALLIKPQWAEPFLKKGYVYMNMGDFPKAIESLKKFMELDPENPQAPVAEEIIKSLQQ